MIRIPDGNEGKMTKEQMIVAIVVAFIGFLGAGVSAGFAFAQFMIKRKDEIEEKDIQKKIDDAIENAMEDFISKCGEIGDEQISRAKDEVRKEFQEGLKERGEEGRERFEVNSEQIQKNAETLGRLLKIQEDQAKKADIMMESLTALNKTTAVCAEGVKSTIYDKLYMIAQKAMARKGITADEKANITQLWKSYSALNGNGRGETYYKICMEDLPVLSDEEALRKDNKVKQTV